MRTKLAVLAAAGLAAGAGAAWLAGQNRNVGAYQIVGAPVCLLVGWSFIGCGLIAWQQRPGNRLGPVMIFIGFAWFASFLTDARDPLLFTTGTTVQSVYLVGFVYLILSFPSGRLRGWLEHGLFWSVVAIVIVVHPISMLVTDSGAVLWTGAPANLLEVGRNDGLAIRLLEVERLAGAALASAGLVLLASRWRSASAAQRHAMAPVLWAGRRW